jgi:hypothetical protein
VRRGYRDALDKLGKGNPLDYGWLYRRVRGDYQERQRHKKAG